MISISIAIIAGLWLGMAAVWYRIDYNVARGECIWRALTYFPYVILPHPIPAILLLIALALPRIAEWIMR